MHWKRFALALAAPLLLTACLLTPGKFTSTLDIKRDRGFTFTYVGETILIDPQEKMKPAPPLGGEDGDEGREDASPAPAGPAAPVAETEEQIVKRRGIAEALSKERGYRSVAYLGKGKFRVDYALTGRLDHNFVFPFNTDAEAIIPWVAIEVRKDGSVRVKAPAFGKASGGTPTPGNPFEEASGEREGTFTLTSDATLVMQNNEDGMASGPGARPGTRIVWTITPTSQTVPTAVLRFAN